MIRPAKPALAGTLLTALLVLGGCTTDRDEPRRNNVEARGSSLPDYDLGTPDDQRTLRYEPIPTREVDQNPPPNRRLP